LDSTSSPPTPSCSSSLRFATLPPANPSVHRSFYDQDYNPHNDKQAEDRAYRIGQVRPLISSLAPSSVADADSRAQKRDVNIIKFITKGSLEEDMRQLATNKLLLDSEVSSTSQYPTGAAPEESEGNNAQVEKKCVALRFPYTQSSVLTSPSLLQDAHFASLEPQEGSFSLSSTCSTLADPLRLYQNFERESQAQSQSQAPAAAP